MSLFGWAAHASVGAGCTSRSPGAFRRIIVAAVKDDRYRWASHTHQGDTMLPTSASRTSRWVVVPLSLVAVAVLLVLAVLAAALALGGPTPPPTMHSISDPFKGLSLEGIPPLSRFTARDGSALAYRHYAPTAGQSARDRKSVV